MTMATVCKTIVCATDKVVLIGNYPHRTLYAKMSSVQICFVLLRTGKSISHV